MRFVLTIRQLPPSVSIDRSQTTAHMKLPKGSNNINPILKSLLVFVLLAAAGFAADDFAETKKEAEVGEAYLTCKRDWCIFAACNTLGPWD